MPWSHISCGVSEKWLAHERKKAAAEKTTPDCTFGPCSGCGACQSVGVNNQLAEPRVNNQLLGLSESDQVASNGAGEEEHHE